MNEHTTKKENQQEQKEKGITVASDDAARKERDEKIKNESDTERLRSERQSVQEGEQKGKTRS